MKGFQRATLFFVVFLGACLWGQGVGHTFEEDDVYSDAPQFAENSAAQDAWDYWEGDVAPRRSERGGSRSSRPQKRGLVVRGGMGAAEESGASGVGASEPVDTGPDVEEVQGAPTYLYKVEEKKPLRDATLESPSLFDSRAKAIWETLKIGSSGVELPAPLVRAVLLFYKERSFSPLWLTSFPLAQRIALSLNEKGGSLQKFLSEKALNVVHYIGKADEEGLDPKAYQLKALSAPTFDLTTLAKLEVQLTAAALLYARQASGGQLIPGRLSGYHDLSPPVVPAEEALEAFGKREDVASYLASLHPTLPAYALFKAALQKFQKGTRDRFSPIPNGAILRLGDKDPRLSAVRLRLLKLGILSQEDFSSLSLSETFSGEDRLAIRQFQKTSGLYVDGALGRKTLAALNQQEDDSAMQLRIIANMERLRWLPRNLGKKYVFVNEASFYLMVIENQDLIWKTRVVVGKKNTQTFMFNDQIETVEFNPYWGVPFSIVKNEMAPLIRKDPYYLERNNYEVTDARGRKIASSAMNASSFSRPSSFYVRQRPGSNNALGEVKFLFPNAHAIYMHDTPTRSLFKRPVRAFSHGCVRVENPRQFAQILLNLSEEEVAKHLATKRNHSLRVSPPVPVYLSYFTLWPAEKDTLKAYKDIYGRDALMEKAFQKTADSYGN